MFEGGIKGIVFSPSYIDWLCEQVVWLSFVLLRILCVHSIVLIQNDIENCYKYDFSTGSLYLYLIIHFNWFHYFPFGMNTHFNI